MKLSHLSGNNAPDIICNQRYNSCVEYSMFIYSIAVKIRT